MTPTEHAWQRACGVTDPELPMLTLHDLGVLRDLSLDGDRVIVSITPTYSGCPAMATMRQDLERVLFDDGFDDVEVRVQLSPAWSSDDITENGRHRLAEAGISPPGTAQHEGSVTLSLQPTRRELRCPQCGSSETSSVSEFGATPCKALYRCEGCLETFEHVKEI